MSLLPPAKPVSVEGLAYNIGLVDAFRMDRVSRTSRSVAPQIRNGKKALTSIRCISALKGNRLMKALGADSPLRLLTQGSFTLEGTANAALFLTTAADYLEQGTDKWDEKNNLFAGGPIKLASARAALEVMRDASIAVGGDAKKLARILASSFTDVAEPGAPKVSPGLKNETPLGLMLTATSSDSEPFAQAKLQIEGLARLEGLALSEGAAASVA